jgi:L-seryl-tRNA(Ser) seleniumtransferase
MVGDKQSLLRRIPAVDRVLAAPELEDAMNTHPRSLVVEAVHQVLDELRRDLLREETKAEDSVVGLSAVSRRVTERLTALSRPRLTPVINGTGVVIHTNLGRSILPERVIDRFGPLGGGYSNLEYDLERGKRGSRYTHVEYILKELTSAPAATVVNNNAAAVLLCLDTLAKGREVVVSRGQLVEIGGSFRIPEVMRKSGSKLVEVGTTNKTHLRDYAEAIGPETGLLLKVHTSNFQIVGFTEEVPLSDLVKLGNRHGIPVMEDLGSGSLIDFSKYGLKKEPTVQETLAQGADLVTFSGDKLLGGPQAGIILGREDLVDAVRKNQLARALRIDKLTLLALEETLRIYRDEEKALKEIPTLRMITEPCASLREKGALLLQWIGRVDDGNFSLEMAEGDSKVGGGALPLMALPSCLLCLLPGKLSPQFMERWLRGYDPPIIGRVERERVILDVRTIQEREMGTVAEAIRRLSQALG